jgi:arylsulfatase A-like enzyme
MLPNVLVVMADQLRATASALHHPFGVATPAYERLAASGVRFDAACTPHPLCVPARVSLWTGRWPHAHGARRNETLMPASERHAFHVWHEHGFELGLIGKNHCFTAADQALFDVWCELEHEGRPLGSSARGMAWVRSHAAIDAAHAPRRAMPRQGQAVSWSVSDTAPEDASSGVIAAQTVAFLRARAAAERPFALWVSFPDPHTPYEVPRAVAARVPPESVRESPPPTPSEFARMPERMRVLQRLLGTSDASEADRRALVATYLAQVRFVDDGVGEILDALEESGLRERTIVVFTSDHGDFTGVWGLTRKGGSFHDAMVRVPLAISFPGVVPSGVVEGSPVNLVDVVPTVLQLQGLAAPGGMQGRPLPGATDAPARDATCAEYGAGGAPCTLADLDALGLSGLEAAKATLRWREAEGRRKMIRTARWKFTTDPHDGVDELYDLQADPDERRNLAGEKIHEATIADLRARLLTWMITTEDAHPPTLPPAAADAATPKGSTA